MESADLLVLTETGSDELVRGLLALGHRVDCASSLPEVQRMFLDCGGHAVVIIAPDISSALATRAITSLRRIDADLPIVTFGELTLRGSTVPHLLRIRSFHPESRAGLGAIQ
jgi:hypothetical protein